MINNLNNRIIKLSFIILITTIILFGVSCSEKDNSYENISQSSENSVSSLENSEIVSDLSENLSGILSSEESNLSHFNSDSDKNFSENESTENSFESDISENSELTESSVDSESNSESEDAQGSENSDSDSETNDIQSSVNSDNNPESEDAQNSEESDSSNKIFSEPEGREYTTSKGNVFSTNCTDDNIIKIMCEIADTAAEYNKATVYYTDVSQKYFFAYNANLVHNTASTIKAPYASYILQSGADLSEKLVMEKRHMFTGSGVLKNKEPGSVFTVSELIKYMITRSDNTAYAMLLERFGTQGFREYAKSLNVDFKLPSGGYTTCKAREMAAFLLDIYNYQGTERGKTLIKHMKNCSYSLQIPKAVSHEVAHKFGFIYEGKAFHDMGIVYAPTPYIEIIFTRIDGTVYDTKAFIQIGKLVEKLNMELSDKY